VSHLIFISTSLNELFQMIRERMLPRLGCHLSSGLLFCRPSSGLCRHPSFPGFDFCPKSHYNLLVRFCRM
jgi:hypothetical protein